MCLIVEKEWGRDVYPRSVCVGAVGALRVACVGAVGGTKTATQQASPAHAWGQAPGARAGPLIPNQASAEAWPCKRLSTAARATENLRHTRVKR